ncbi:MAG: FAD-dependent thymidylate synthase [Candidatus Zapsychrus exili]|nr:FAD-dependent thymidylate synthase [Candidatus Zapsychrus exili]
MKVYLAGFNVDTAVLEELQKKAEPREDVTPEVISAAYARISRDPRKINEIREAARGEVERSRKSNSTIIFKMGHHSVAEHAVFNLDVIGLSRFCMEDLEKFRLCSYTEKSQRYITLDNDYVVPKEIKDTNLESKFVDMIQKQNEAYFVLFEKLKKHVFEKHSDLALDSKNHSLLEGWAKEDARYITALATESQVGLTVNARNFELMLRRFASHPLAEVKQLGRQLYEKIEKVAPSIVLFHQENDRDSKTFSDLKEVANKIINDSGESTKQSKEVELVEYTKEGDLIVAASLLHVSTKQPYEKCKDIVRNLSREELEKIFKTAWGNMQFYDSMLREFEYVNLTFNVELSSACFGQLKRHRMSTITAQPYDIDLGITIPDRIKEIGADGYFKEIVERTNEVYKELKAQVPEVAPYILTNAHRKRVLIRVNARELYHISRLREDAHAQWDIQNVSCDMVAQAKEVMPLTFGLIGGKDKYNEIFKNIYGKLPKVTEAVLPAARKI